MKPLLSTVVIVLSLAVFHAAPLRAQRHDGQYPYSWNHAHEHTCAEYSEYPWTRCQAKDEHVLAVTHQEIRHSCDVRSCTTCNHEHCSPRHMYDRNLELIRDLKCSYCTPNQYVETLCRQNESAYHDCRMYPARTCFQCNPPAGYGCRPTLEQVNVELASLKSKCFVNTHR